MKRFIKTILYLAIIILIYLCIKSVITPIRFQKIKAEREKIIIERLIDIRKAELEFKAKNGYYTSSFDSLIQFLKTAKKKIVMKQDALSEKQLEAGLTEDKAISILKSGNLKQIMENDLQTFRRDTSYINMIEAIFLKRYSSNNIQYLAIIPFSKNKRFELRAKNNFIDGSGNIIPLFECEAHFRSYLFDLEHQEMLNLIDLQEKLFRFPGLKIGSIDEPNNNAGNWE